MFDFGGVSAVVRKEILEMLNRYIASGMNLYNAIDASSRDAKDKKIAQILKKVKIDSDRLNNIPQALKNNKIINDREYTILLNAKSNIKVALGEIIKLSDGGTQFEIMMMKAVIIPCLVLVGSMYAPMFIAPYIKGIFVEFEKTLSIKIELDWYLSTVIDYAHVYAGIATFILALLGVGIFFYFYLYKNRIDLVYKFFRYKALVDTPYVLSLMVSLNKSTGMNLTFVCNALKNTVSPKSMANFFRKIEAEKNSNNLFETLVGFGFDRGVARVCSLGQNKGINDFWENMNKGLIFAEEQLKVANAKWEVATKRNVMLSVFVAIAILLNSIAYVTLMSSKLERTLKTEMGRTKR